MIFVSFQFSCDQAGDRACGSNLCVALFDELDEE